MNLLKVMIASKSIVRMGVNLGRRGAIIIPPGGIWSPLLMTEETATPSVKCIHGAAYNAKKAKRLVMITALGLMVFAGGEYVAYTHITNVPITGRGHVVYLSRKEEMKIKKDLITTTLFRNPAFGGSSLIKNPNDQGVIMVHRIITAMKRACMYFDPDGSDYFKEMDTFYLKLDDVNAFSSLGGFIVIYSGIVDYCNSMSKTVEDTEEMLAAVIAHEMGHSLARHALESLLHIYNFFYYVGLLFTGDVFILPEIKEMADNRLSTKCEYEADIIGMYLMKRAGYSVEKYIETIGGLPDKESSMNKTIRSFFSTHPSPKHRKEALLAALPQLEEDFRDKYSVDNTEFYYVNYFMYYCYSHLCKEFMV